MLLKKASSGVLRSKESSTYRKGTPAVLSTLGALLKGIFEQHHRRMKGPA